MRGGGGDEREHTIKLRRVETKRNTSLTPIFEPFSCTVSDYFFICVFLYSFFVCFTELHSINRMLN